MPRISFGSKDLKFSLKNKRELSSWITAVIRDHHAGYENLAFVFCSDDALLEINRQFLQHDFYTDIITFDYSVHRNRLVVSGEIFLSIDRIKENADKFKTSFATELHRVMIHGVLHLLGYKDKTPSERKAMRLAEQQALNRLSEMA